MNQAVTTLTPTPLPQGEGLIFSPLPGGRGARGEGEYLTCGRMGETY